MSALIQDRDVFAGVVTRPDNKQGAISDLLRVNAHYRKTPWPSPFHATTHTVDVADARDLSCVPDESVHLIVTSPPYWTLKDYPPHQAQRGAIVDYDRFLAELDKPWRECN